MSFISCAFVVLCIVKFCAILRPTAIFRIIRERYGNDILHEARSLERLSVQHAKLMEDIDFLSTCESKNLVPTFTVTKPSIMRHRNSKLTAKYRKDMLTDELKHKRKKLKKQNTKLRTLRTLINAKLSLVDRVRLHRQISKEVSDKSEAARTIHRRKLFKLGYSAVKTPDPSKVIFNYSSKVLTQDEEELLALGLDYGLNPKLKTAKYFLPFEKVANKVFTQNLPKEDYDRAIREIKHIAWKSYEHIKEKGTRPVLTNAQKQCLVNLSKDKNILITRADKGKACVVMDRGKYTEQITEMVSDTSKFEEIKDDIFKLNMKLEDKVNRFLLQLLKKNAITEESQKRMRATGSYPATLYALPKVHKVTDVSNIPLRPVISGYRAHNYRIAKYLNTLLEPYTQNEYIVKDTFSFLDSLADFNPPQNCHLASFDIKSLYPSIPLKETIELVTEKVFENTESFHCLEKKDFKKLLTLASADSYFFFDEKLYRITDGLAIGNPIAGTLANIFLCHHENIWLEQCPPEFKPMFYKRYIDDTCLVFENSTQSEKFLSYINEKHANIKFTCENEINKILPFLDVKIDREGGIFHTAVYRKATFTGLATNFTSFVPSTYKFNLIGILVYRAIKICSDKVRLNSEIIFIKNYLIENAFPIKVIEKTVKQVLKKYAPANTARPNVTERENIYMKFPFFGNQSSIVKKELLKTLKRVFPNENCKLIFTNNFRIKSYFPYKDRMDPLLLSDLVYKFNCVSCNETYIGITSRNFFIRICEHIGRSPYTDRIMRDPKFSAVREHCKPDCTIGQDNFKIIDRGEYKSDLYILESIHIKMDKPTLNTTESFVKIF